MSLSHGRPPPPGRRPPRGPTRPVVVRVGAAEIPFHVADRPGEPVRFSLGIRKSGSTMLHWCMQALGAANGMNVVNMPDTFFHHGFRVADWQKADLSAAIAPGNLYTGFRTLPANVVRHPLFGPARKVLLVRDPRDALVSQYFSDAYSHTLPSAGTETARQGAEAFARKRAEALATDIADFVLKHARNFDRTMLAFAPLLDDPECLVLRYEEVVLRKPGMFAALLGHFGWHLAPGALERLLAQVDRVPDSEDPTRFVRRVVPGDHREKLAPDTIARLEDALAACMDRFGYRRG